jgi:hypothetical protein
MRFTSAVAIMALAGCVVAAPMRPTRLQDNSGKFHLLAAPQNSPSSLPSSPLPQSGRSNSSLTPLFTAFRATLPNNPIDTSKFLSSNHDLIGKCGKNGFPLIEPRDDSGSEDGSAKDGSKQSTNTEVDQSLTYKLEDTHPIHDINNIHVGDQKIWPNLIQRDDYGSEDEEQSKKPSNKTEVYQSSETDIKDTHPIHDINCISIGKEEALDIVERELISLLSKRDDYRSEDKPTSQTKVDQTSTYKLDDKHRINDINCIDVGGRKFTAPPHVVKRMLEPHPQVANNKVTSHKHNEVVTIHHHGNDQRELEPANGGHTCRRLTTACGKYPSDTKTKEENEHFTTVCQRLTKVCEKNGHGGPSSSGGHPVQETKPKDEGKPVPRSIPDQLHKDAEENFDKRHQVKDEITTATKTHDEASSHAIKWENGLPPIRVVRAEHGFLQPIIQRRDHGGDAEAEAAAAASAQEQQEQENAQMQKESQQDPSAAAAATKKPPQAPVKRTEYKEFKYQDFCHEIFDLC